VLAAGYGVLIGSALVLGVEPVYAVLLTALLMTIFFALLSWRSNRDWEQMMSQLRPFVASQRWYESLTTTPDGVAGSTDPFFALSDTMLNTSVAYLIPAGPTAAFVQPQGYPSDRPIPALGDLFDRPVNEGTLMHAVDPLSHGGAAWAIPLWSERGSIGTLLLGPRIDNSLYTQEEMEIARSTGERLIDTAASIALSQRLMQLQRKRLATTQILDQRTRRVLHDDVLPLIHTAMLSLAAGESSETAIQRLGDAHQKVSELLRELPMTTAPEIKRLGLIGALQKMLGVEFAQAFDEIEWQIERGIDEPAAQMTPLAAETIYYATRELVRNAAKYARSAVPGEVLRLTVSAHVVGGEFLLSVQDDGIGFNPGVGDGHGLALHSTMMAIAGGSLALESTPGRVTRAELLMPLES
jgi:signal transduction histidine kinase